MAIPHPDDILTTAEVCRLLKITRPTLYHWIADGRLSPWKKLGGGSTFLFLRSDAAGGALKKYARPSAPPPARGLARLPAGDHAAVTDPESGAGTAADVLFISRDAALLRQSASDLQGEGYRVSIAGDLDSLGDVVGPEKAHDIIVLDLDVSGKDAGAASGWRLFEKIKKLAGGPGRHAPVYLLLSGRHTAPRYAAEALKRGAWDFLKKPADPGVFTARIRLALRRRFWSELDAGAGPVLASRDKGILLAPGRRIVEVRDAFGPPAARRLTRKESELLALFLKRPWIVFSKATLLEIIWGYAVDIRTRTVDCHIKNLRQKLTPLGGRIETRYGAGYRFTDPH